MNTTPGASAAPSPARTQGTLVRLAQGGLMASSLLLLGAAVVAADAPTPARSALSQAAERFVQRQTVRATADKAQPLATRGAQSAEGALLAYLRRNAARFGLRAADVATLTVERILTTPHNGATYVTLGQRLGGLRVHGALFSATFDARGRLLLVAGRASAQRGGGNALLSADDALGRAALLGGARAVRPLPAAARTRAAGRHAFPNPYPRGLRDPVPLRAELVWHMGANGALRLAWETDVEVSDTSWYETHIDAETGAVLERESRYRSQVQGRVFTEQHPDNAPSGRSLQNFSGINGSWVYEVAGATTTSGNNTITYRDFGDDNALGYQPLATDNDTRFDFAFGDLWAGLDAIDPNDFGNVPQADWEGALDGDLDAAVTQLFYYINQTHDWLYAYGFDEASGNFQHDNFGNGGVAGDRVVAETHNGFDFGCDGGTRCINNANFGTDGDGTAARMQMYLSIPPDQPYADRSFNGDTIVHEYGHGVSNRLVPGTLSGATNQAGSLGEGWSDALAFLRWDDPVYGDYTSFDKINGIRNFAYDANPWTYGNYDTGAGSPHRNGEIWAAALYDVRTRVGIDTTTWLVLDGMRNTVGPSPTFLDARDGVLVADTLKYADAHYCALWSAFAGRGMGTNAVSNGINAAPTEDFSSPAACAPVADAGGPYVTVEGTNVALSAAGSSAGSHPSASGTLAYAWDLDNDGAYDDATGVDATFERVGQDASFTVGLQVTDGFGVVDTTTTTVAVNNVLPTVTIDAITPVDEHGTVRVRGSITDPGWLEPLSATIDFDDGTGPQALGGVLDNTRPEAALVFEVQRQYGDNGSYEIEVCGRDLAGGAPNAQQVCYTALARIDNVDPTMAIQTAAMQSYNGKQAFVLPAGGALEVPGTASDPGSDDLVFTWAWDDGTPDAVQVSRVNPPAADPAKSPSVQPRDVTLAQSHVYTGACLYDLRLTVADDDGGSASDTAAVVVTGNADLSRGSGWWLNQYRVKRSNDFTGAQLQCYLDIVTFFSSVFTAPLNRTQATQILHLPAKSPMLTMFREQLLAAWLNFANGAVAFDTPVDTSGDGIADTTWAAAILQAELVANNPASTNAQVKAQKDIVERIVLRDE